MLDLLNDLILKGLQIDDNEVKKLETTCKNIVARLEDKSCLMKHISPIESEVNFTKI